MAYGVPETTAASASRRTTLANLDILLASAQQHLSVSSLPRYRHRKIERGAFVRELIASCQRRSVKPCTDARRRTYCLLEISDVLMACLMILIATLWGLSSSEASQKSLASEILGASPPNARPTMRCFGPSFRCIARNNTIRDLQIVIHLYIHAIHNTGKPLAIILQILRLFASELRVKHFKNLDIMRTSPCMAVDKFHWSLRSADPDPLRRGIH